MRPGRCWVVWAGSQGSDSKAMCGSNARTASGSLVTMLHSRRRATCTAWATPLAGLLGSTASNATASADSPSRCSSTTTGRARTLTRNGRPARRRPRSGLHQGCRRNRRHDARLQSNVNQSTTVDRPARSDVQDSSGRIQDPCLSRLLAAVASSSWSASEVGCCGLFDGLVSLTSPEAVMSAPSSFTARCGSHPP